LTKFLPSENLSDYFRLSYCFSSPGVKIQETWNFAAPMQFSEYLQSYYMVI